MTEIVLDIQKVTMIYNEKPVLWDLNIKVPAGHIIGIIGPNGAGKSTLLKSILGIIKPLTGRILLFGKNNKANRKRVAYVPQRRIIDWNFPISVLEVVMMGLYKKIGWFKRPNTKDKTIAMEALKKLGMEKYSHRQIDQLSGGEQQRVFLARALVQEADLYIMDEPLQGVDAVTEKAIIALLNELKKQGKTVIVVHHDLQTVTEYFDWLILLNVKCIVYGPKEEVFNKQNLKETYEKEAIRIDEQNGLEEDKNKLMTKKISVMG